MTGVDVVCLQHGGVYRPVVVNAKTLLNLRREEVYVCRYRKDKHHRYRMAVGGKGFLPVAIVLSSCL